MAEKKKVFELSDLLKIFGVLALFIPLMTAVIQYRQSVKQDLDKNFRGIVEMLSSQDREKRLAAATNMGVFIKKGEYSNEAIDILINRLSTELDYNILNAIKGSLRKKRGRKELKDVIVKILGINKNIFIQNYALKKWKEESEKEYFEKEALYNNFKNKKSDKTILDNIKEEMKLKQKVYFDRERDFKELPMHEQVTADFISMFLEETKDIEDINFYLNSLNKVRLLKLNFIRSTFERSAISSSTVEETIFDNATIIDSLFTFSDLTKSRFVNNCKITASLFNHISSLKGVSFSGSEFNDVFFTGSDLTEANFKGAKGLKPIYFYKAKNIKKAEFDNEFKIKLTNELGFDSEKMADEKFLEYIKSSELRFRKDKVAELERTLNELKTPQQEKDQKKSKTF